MSSNAEQASLNDFTFPTNSNSRSIPVLYGTVWVSGNIIYYNNLLSLKIKACSQEFLWAEVVKEEVVANQQVMAMP